MSTFDPQSFLNATITEPTTKRSALPAQEYIGVVSDINAKSGSKEGKDWYALEVTLALEIPGDIRAALGLATGTLKVKDNVFLDVTASGGIDAAPGKNGKLGMYRKALGLNNVGDSFSPAQMVGQTLLVKIKHDIYQDQIQEKVAAVAKLA
jgi:hypothetical protein